MDRIENDAPGTSLQSFDLATIGYIDPQTHASNNFFYCFVYSLPRERAFRAAALIGEINTHKLMGEISKVRRYDGLRYHDIHTKFRKE
jgi:hypothetical protein